MQQRAHRREPEQPGVDRMHPVLQRMLFDDYRGMVVPLLLQNLNRPACVAGDEVGVRPCPCKLGAREWLDAGALHGNLVRRAHMLTGVENAQIPVCLRCL